MTLPALVLSLIIATLYGALYHFIRGGSGKRLLLYIFLSWSGFAAGQWLAVARGWSFFPLGTIQLGVATIGSYLFLGFGDWLTRFEIPKTDH